MIVLFLLFFREIENKALKISNLTRIKKHIFNKKHSLFCEYKKLVLPLSYKKYILIYDCYF